jgi:lipopolysaccharide transport system ATP-binding protein
MYMRLAFSVAAHLEPEILVVDEVLAVGDATFQKKCLGKMGEVASSGRTVLFVSHNMHAIERLSSEIIHLVSGQIQYSGPDVFRGIQEYSHLGNLLSSASEWINPGHLYNAEEFTPTRCHLGSRTGEVLTMPVANDDEFWFYVEGDISDYDDTLIIGYTIYGDDGDIVYQSSCKDQAERFWPRIGAGKVKLRAPIPQRLLNEGTYQVELFAVLHLMRGLINPGSGGPALALSISGGISDSPLWVGRRPGAIVPMLTWENNF